MEAMLLVAAVMILLGGFIIMLGIADMRAVIAGVIIACLFGIAPMVGVAIYAPEMYGTRPNRLAVFTDQCHAACVKCAACGKQTTEQPTDPLNAE